MKYTFSEFEFDGLRGELRHKGQLVRLEPQVCQLLTMLISRHGEFVSRDEILEEIWIGRSVSSQVVDNRIRAARIALGDNGKRQKYIKTYPNRGFRFVAEIENPILEKEPQSDTTNGWFYPVGKILNGYRIRPEFISSIGILMVLSIIITKISTPPSASNEVISVWANPKPVVVVLPLIEDREDIHSKRYGTQLAGVMIDALSRVSDLNVISSLLSFPMADQSTNPKDTLNTLRADYLVTNSIWRDEEGFNATIQLVRADNGVVEWSKNFHQKVSHNSESIIVDSIANEALNSISDKLGIDPKLRLNKINNLQLEFLPTKNIS